MSRRLTQLLLMLLLAPVVPLIVLGWLVWFLLHRTKTQPPATPPIIAPSNAPNMTSAEGYLSFFRRNRNLLAKIILALLLLPGIIVALMDYLKPWLDERAERHYEQCLEQAATTAPTRRAERILVRKCNEAHGR